MSEEKKLKIEKVDIADGGRYGKFVCEPLDRGYGTVSYTHLDVYKRQY